MLEALGISHEDNTVWTEAIAHAQRRAREDSARRSGSAKGKEKDIGPPSLWRIPVRRGREEEIASLLGGRLLALEETPPIRSIVGRCANPGYILVKTDAFDHVVRLCQGVSDILNTPVLESTVVPVEAVPTCLEFQPCQPRPGTWVRLNHLNGIYAGDFAWVHSVDKRNIATVLYFPRVDHSRSYDQTQKKGCSRRRKRPQQALLTFAEA
ncbi:hypothetical protein H0H92_015040, partial [Tricholoma furcatifolium]